MTGELVIGRVEAGDLGSVRILAKARLREGYTIELFQHLFESQPGCFLTAKEDDELMGFLVGVPVNGTSLRILMIAVKSTMTRRGIGSMLMGSAERYAFLRKMTSIVLEVGIGNKDAIGFYNHLGYQMTELITEYYKDRSDAFKMRKYLSM